MAQNPTEDLSIIDMVYQTCMVAHVWRSLTVNNGRLYRCPQSLVYAERESDYSDSVYIRDIKSVKELLLFLENDACKACAQCLGSVGKEFPCGCQLFTRISKINENEIFFQMFAEYICEVVCNTMSLK